ncbi:hypothetical protein P9K38_09960 [Pseudomonas sp. 905_Psudmo1]|nr:hypothetical protein [Pseudomonas sp. 905_Psudmo1]WFS20634.1 hypothetical protein P9K38_09960 [Pseudomonas sp. 905_Psudmo1]
MRFLDLRGTFSTLFRLGINGLQLKSAGGKVRARNADDTDDVPLVGSSIQASGDSLTLNEGAAGAGDDWTLTISRPDTGMTQNLNFKMPANYGTADFVLKTDGAGNLSWGASASATNLEATDTTDLEFDSTGTVAMFQLPANAVVRLAAIIVDAPFDGAPSLSIGVTGELSRYLGSTQVDLTAAAGTVFEVDPAAAAEVTAQDLIATYSAGGATEGAARMLVSYVIPS